MIHWPLFRHLPCTFRNFIQELGYSSGPGYHFWELGTLVGHNLQEPGPNHQEPEYSLQEHDMTFRIQDIIFRNQNITFKNRI